MKAKRPPSKRPSSTASSKSDGKSPVTAFYHDNRGQTLFDFLLGITLFLGVVAFTVLFIPNLIDPFEPTRDASTILADRGADHLTQNVMRMEGEGPYILETECTVDFFDGNAMDSCDVDSNSIREIVGMRNSASVHVKIIDSDGNTISVNGVQLGQGDDIEGSTSSTYTATRIVTLNGQRYTLVYNVW